MLSEEVLKKSPPQPCEMTSVKYLVPWCKLIAQVLATGSTYLRDTCKHTLSQLVPIMLLLLLLLPLSSLLLYMIVSKLDFPGASDEMEMET